MDNSLPTNAGIWAAVGTAFVAIVGGMYKAYRMIKGDLREDRNISSLDKYMESKDKRIRELEERNDKLAEERNNAIETTGALNGQLKWLSEDLARVSAENVKLKNQLENK